MENVGLNAKTLLSRKALLLATIVAVALVIAALLASCAGGSVSRESNSAQASSGAASSGAASSTASTVSSSHSSERYGNLRDFKTTAFDGTQFTSDDLSKYDLTMVNIWTTTCPYCIKEMPGLELLSGRLPENVNFVSLCVDGDSNRSAADKILADTNITFKVVCSSDSLNSSLLKYVSGVPTTVYVDREGNIVGPPQVGAPPVSGDEAVAKFYIDQIQDRLSQVA